MADKSMAAGKSKKAFSLLSLGFAEQVHDPV